MRTKKLNFNPFEIEIKLRHMKSKQKELNTMLDILESKWENIMATLNKKV